MAKDFDIYVNEALGVCVAKYPYASEELWEEYSKCTAKFANAFGANECFCDDYVFEGFAKLWFNKHGKAMNNLTGKARCRFEDGDVFDEEFGVTLAKKRLAEKLEFYRADFYGYMYDVLTSFAIKTLYSRSEYHWERANTIATQAFNMATEGEF